MSSLNKALGLLRHFSVTKPEIGLSQICRIAKCDKATTYRHLKALEIAGFIEKNLSTKQYRLGPALLQLAQTREATVPRKASAEGPLTSLAHVTGETAHVTVLSGATVYSLVSCESPRHGTRVILDNDTFPLHATASGLCALAFGPEDLMNAARAELTAFTETTLTTSDALSDAVKFIRETGFGYANRSFEAEVKSLSTPLFDQTGHYAGAVSVACVATRFTHELEQTIKEHLVIVSREITYSWGGFTPKSIEDLWFKSLTPTKALETAQ